MKFCMNPECPFHVESDSGQLNYLKNPDNVKVVDVRGSDISTPVKKATVNRRVWRKGNQELLYLCGICSKAVEMASGIRLETLPDWTDSSPVMGRCTLPAVTAFAFLMEGKCPCDFCNEDRNKCGGYEK